MSKNSQPPSSRGGITTKTTNPAEPSPPSWRPGHGPARRTRHSNPRPDSERAGTIPSTRPRNRRGAARAVPTVHQSYVVEISAPAETSPDVIARIRPTEHAATAAAEHGLRFGDALLDIVAALLVEIARDEEGGEES